MLPQRFCRHGTTRRNLVKEAEMRADERAAQVPVPASKLDYGIMRRTLEEMLGKLNQEEIPSKAYTGSEMEDFEENEVRAESSQRSAQRTMHRRIS
eukprot:11081671-Karenia_brevis.AAC.1